MKISEIPIHWSIIIVLLITIGVGWIYVNAHINDLSDKVVYWQNETAKKDSLTKKYKTLYNKSAIKVEKLDPENDYLKKELKKTKGQLRQQIEINARIESDTIKDIPTTNDTIIDTQTHSTISIAKFDTIQNEFYIKGWFEKQPPWRLTIEKLEALILADVSVVQYKDGHWETFVDTNSPRIEIIQLSTKVNPYQPPWYHKIHGGVGTYFGQGIVGLSVDINYGHYGLIINANNYGIAYGIRYSFGY